MIKLINVLGKKPHFQLIQFLNGVDHYGSHLSKDEEQGQGGGEDDEGVGEDVQDERGGPAQL